MRRRFVQPPLPLRRLHVELTNACNFTCAYCPNPSMARPRGHMSAALLDAVLEQTAAVGLARLVLFHQQGEPTLHPRLGAGVRRATALGLQSCVATNGSLLTNELVDELLDGGLTRLVVSLQTPDEASYAHRGAPSLGYAAFEERVVGALRRVLAAGAETEVAVSFLTRPPLRWRLGSGRNDGPMVATDAELHALLSRWTRLLLDGAQASDALRAVTNLSVSRQDEMWLAPRLIVEARPVRDWAMPSHPPGRRWFPATIGRCHSQGLTDHIAILWDGQYSFCCADHDGRTSTERFPDLSLLDFLDSAAVQAAISGFAHRRLANPYCQLCLGGPARSYALLKSAGAAAWFGLFDRNCCAMGSPPPGERQGRGN